MPVSKAGSPVTIHGEDLNPQMQNFQQSDFSRVVSEIRGLLEPRLIIRWIGSCVKRGVKFIITRQSFAMIRTNGRVSIFRNLAYPRVFSVTVQYLSLKYSWNTVNDEINEATDAKITFFHVKCINFLPKITFPSVI